MKEVPYIENYSECIDDFSGMTCKECGERIYSGQPFVEIGSNAYHLECLRIMDAQEIINLFGYSVQEAG